MCTIATKTVLIAGALGLAGATAALGQGRLIVANDEWTLSNHGFAQAPATGVFVDNITSFFAGGGSGSFLAYSQNFGLIDSALSQTMGGLGHAWTVSTAVPFDLPTLNQFDGVFVGGRINGADLDTSVLLDYVLGGGSVYLAAGAMSTGGYANAAEEASAWNPFLSHFGLALESSRYNGLTGVIPIEQQTGVFAGVEGLFQQNGQDILVTAPSDFLSLVNPRLPGTGLYAVVVPAPGAAAVLAIGSLGLLRRRR